MDYVFQEYPKWVTVGDAEPVLCADETEELVLIEEAKPKRGRPAKADDE